ncbi:MAG: mobile mystery protein A [Ignavibacteriales bacterium]|nr:MAG: mobile mystery protein A [Ignavibacteriales bacterium]
MVKTVKNEKQDLIIEQLDKKFDIIQKAFETIPVPSNGWINTIRKTINMSLRQLGKKLKVSTQNINQLEQREKDGSISIQKLKETAEALNCYFLYAVVPKNGSLKKMIEDRANEIARDIVLRTSHSMKLEDQENSAERINRAIKEKAEKIRNELPKYLWD